MELMGVLRRAACGGAGQRSGLGLHRCDPESRRPLDVGKARGRCWQQGCVVVPLQSVWASCRGCLCDIRRRLQGTWPAPLDQLSDGYYVQLFCSESRMRYLQICLTQPGVDSQLGVLVDALRWNSSCEQQRRYFLHVTQPSDPLVRGTRARFVGLRVCRLRARGLQMYTWTSAQDALPPARMLPKQLSAQALWIVLVGLQVLSRQNRPVHCKRTLTWICQCDTSTSQAHVW